MKGRKPKPTHLKEIAGNPGKRPLNKNEPKAPPADLLAPAHLRGQELKVWKRLAPLLAAMKVFRQPDRDLLEQYCTAYQEWRRAVTEVRKKGGAVSKTPSGYGQVSPWVARVKAEREEMRRIMVEFGMTPSSRSRLQVAGDLQTPGDEDDDFFEKNTRKHAERIPAPATA